MLCRIRRKTHLSRTCAGLVFLLLLFLETAVLSGRMQMATFLPCAAKWQTTRTAIRGTRTGTPVAALSPATRAGEEVSQAETRQQRIYQRAISGIFIPICGMSVFCLFEILRRLLYRLSDNRPYRRSHFTISYIYNLSHL